MQLPSTILGSVTLTVILVLHVASLEAQVVNPSTMDLWDIREGNEVTANSPIHSGDIREMFGFLPSEGIEPGKALFEDFQPAGTEHWVEWKTPVPITLKSFSLVTFHDPGEQAANARGVSRFTLRAKGANSGNFDIKIFELFPSNPYEDTPVPLGSTLGEGRSWELKLCVEVADIQAQEFRAEFQQFGGLSISGPRVVELDGYSTSACGRLIKYPQIALGGGYEIVAIGSNETDQDWNGTAKLFQGNAEPWNTGWALDGTDMQGSSSFPIQLGADETSKFVLTTTDLKIGSGYLAISPQPGFDPRDIVVSFFYNFLSGGILADSTGTPPSAPARKFVFPVEFQSGASGIDTGVAWVPFQATGAFDVKVQLLASDGSLFQEKTLPFGGHCDDFFTSIFDAVPTGFLGKIVICADSAICLVVLRLELVPGGGFQLTSIPADVLPE